MKKFGKKYISIASSILGGMVFVVGVNTIIFFVSDNAAKLNSNIESDFLNEAFDEQKDRDIIKFYKENTISISFIKNTYEKTNGTAWLKTIDLNQNEFTFCTNLHVVADYTQINEDGSISLNDNINGINIKYFDTDNTNKLFMQRTDIDNWSLTKSFANLKRPIPSQYEGYKNVVTNNGRCYITNGYIDYVELKYKLELSDNSMFGNWLRTRKYTPLIANESEVKSLLKSSYEDNNLDNYIYIAGFPSYNLEPKWVEQKFKIARDGSSDNTYFTSSVHEISPIPWLEKHDGIQLTNDAGTAIEQRSISHQLIFNGLVMGNGSSGSMICARINNKIKIIAIWWGTYGKRMGAGDLLSSNKYNPYTLVNNSHPDPEIKWEDWEGYKLS